MNISLRVLTICAAMLATLPALASTPSNPGAVAQFNLTDKTEIPGHTLKPGTYNISIVDHLSDRIVLRVDDSSGREQAIFLAVPNTNLASSQSGPIEIKFGKASRIAIRGFRFDDGTVAEFVYPKADAVSIAKASSTTVPAIDPASEGRVAKPDLSADDRALVTLWMLTPTTVGPNDQAAIQAERYHAPLPTSNALASNNTPDTLPAQPRPTRVAHPLAALPHTASNLPLILLIAGLSLLSAGFLTLRRSLLTK